MEHDFLEHLNTTKNLLEIINITLGIPNNSQNKYRASQIKKRDNRRFGQNF